MSILAPILSALRRTVRLPGRRSTRFAPLASQLAAAEGRQPFVDGLARLSPAAPFSLPPSPPRPGRQADGPAGPAGRWQVRGRLCRFRSGRAFLMQTAYVGATHAHTRIRKNSARRARLLAAKPISMSSGLCRPSSGRAGDADSRRCFAAATSSPAFRNSTGVLFAAGFLLRWHC